MPKVSLWLVPHLAGERALKRAEAWVAICFICFLGLLAYLGMHTKLTGVGGRCFTARLGGATG